MQLIDADNMPTWIPVSERLPEEYERVLVTIQTPHRMVVRSAEYLDPSFWIDNGDFWRNTDEEVTAWMPLPEPYRRGYTNE